MAHGCGFERRRRDEREQASDLRERLGGHLKRLVDLGALRRQLEREPDGTRLLPREQRIHIDAVARLGRHPPRGGVRVREQPEPLELRKLGTNRRGRHADAASLDEQPRAHRCARRNVLLDDAREDLALPFGELDGVGHGRRVARHSGYLVRSCCLIRPW